MPEMVSRSLCCISISNGRTRLGAVADPNDQALFENGLDSAMTMSQDTSMMRYLDQTIHFIISRKCQRIPSGSSTRSIKFTSHSKSYLPQTVRLTPTTSLRTSMISWAAPLLSSFPCYAEAIQYPYLKAVAIAYSWSDQFCVDDWKEQCDLIREDGYDASDDAEEKKRHAALMGKSSREIESFRHKTDDIRRLGMSPAYRATLLCSDNHEDLEHIQKLMHEDGRIRYEKESRITLLLAKLEIWVAQDVENDQEVESDVVKPMEDMSCPDKAEGQ